MSEQSAGQPAAFTSDGAGIGELLSTPPDTGDRAVNEAVEALADLAGRPTVEQVDVYVGVHRRLQDRLADLDG